MRDCLFPVVWGDDADAFRSHEAVARPSAPPVVQSERPLAVSLNRVVLSRRAILQSAVLAATFSTSATSATASNFEAGLSKAAAAGASTEVALMPVEFVASKCFDEGWSTEFVAYFPQVVEIRGATVAFECRASWDRRLFEVSEGAVAVTPVGVFEIDHEILDDGSTLLSVPAGTTALMFRAAPVNLYPSENIGTPKVTTVDVLLGAEVTTSVPVPSTATPCTPWALAVEADWATMNGFIVPSYVRVLSMGPNPAPASSRIEIVSATRVNANALSASAGLALTVDASSSRTDVGAELVRDLSAGAIETVTFPFDSENSRGLDRNPVIVSSATVILPAETTGMRITQNASAYPVTSSGVPVSTFEAVATA